MFSGIITNIGEIYKIEQSTDDWIIHIQVNLSKNVICTGDSIACNGICLTVISSNEKFICVQISKATREVTSSKHWKSGRKLNLEPSLKIGNALHGHLVSGHVDCITNVLTKEQIGESWNFKFSTPSKVKSLIAKKGSITIDGVSLTVNEVNDKLFEINIVPYTYENTTFSLLKAGSIVNIEVDIIARYVERQMENKYTKS